MENKAPQETKPVQEAVQEYSQSEEGNIEEGYNMVLFLLFPDVHVFSYMLKSCYLLASKLRILTLVFLIDFKRCNFVFGWSCLTVQLSKCMAVHQDGVEQHF